MLVASHFERTFVFRLTSSILQIRKLRLREVTYDHQQLWSAGAETQTHGCLSVRFHPTPLTPLLCIPLGFPLR